MVIQKQPDKRGSERKQSGDGLSLQGDQAALKTRISELAAALEEKMEGSDSHAEAVHGSMSLSHKEAAGRYNDVRNVLIPHLPAIRVTSMSDLSIRIETYGVDKPLIQGGSYRDVDRAADIAGRLMPRGSPMLHVKGIQGMPPEETEETLKNKIEFLRLLVGEGKG